MLGKRREFGERRGDGIVIKRLRGEMYIIPAPRHRMPCTSRRRRNNKKHDVEGAAKRLKVD